MREPVPLLYASVSPACSGSTGSIGVQLIELTLYWCPRSRLTWNMLTRRSSLGLASVAARLAREPSQPRAIGCLDSATSG